MPINPPHIQKQVYKVETTVRLTFQLQVLLKKKYILRKKMKYLILIAALFLVVHASRVELQPGKLQLVELQPGDYEKNVGEIWSNCSEF